MGPQNWNHASKMGRFQVTSQKTETKKWPNSEITQQFFLFGLGGGGGD